MMVGLTLTLILLASTIQAQPTLLSSPQLNAPFGGSYPVAQNIQPCIACKAASSSAGSGTLAATAYSSSPLVQTSSNYQSNSQFINGGATLDSQSAGGIGVTAYSTSAMPGMVSGVPLMSGNSASNGYSNSFSSGQQLNNYQFISSAQQSTNTAALQMQPTLSNQGYSCSAGYNWNGNACVQILPASCQAGYTYNGSCCIMTTALQCSQGTWNGSACISVISGSCPSGYSWNGYSCTSKSPTTCPPGYSAINGTCVISTQLVCDKGVWNGASCVIT